MAFYIEGNSQFDGSIWPLILCSLSTDHDHWWTADLVTITAADLQILPLVSRTTLVNEESISLSDINPWFPDDSASDHRHQLQPPLQ